MEKENMKIRSYEEKLQDLLTNESYEPVEWRQSNEEVDGNMVCEVTFKFKQPTPLPERPGQENISDESQAIRDKVRDDIKEEKGKTLVIWTKDGKTLYFEKVTDFTDGLIETGERRIAFNYSGVSTGVNRYANFNTNAIMGFALEK